MTKIFKEFFGVPVSDYEDNYIKIIAEKDNDIADNYVGAVSLSREAGAESIRYGTMSAFESLHRENRCNSENLDFQNEEEKKEYEEDFKKNLQRWNKYVVDYREKSKRQYPKIYKFKISVEAEELSEEEIEKLWILHGKEYNK